jgi:hypothetical protein
MDLGPQWPFWLRAVCGLAGAALLVRAAWWHAGSLRSGRAMALGFLFWAAVAIGFAHMDEFYCRIPVDLPGCDWEYHRAPVEPWKLLRWMVLGGVVHAIRIGGPLAAVGFAVRCLLLRRRAARPSAITDRPGPG